jgi:hypothetical protein
MSVDTYIQHQFVQRVGAQLPNFKQSKAQVWTFSHSCETKHAHKKQKSRANFFMHNGDVLFKCYHCGIAFGLESFLKEEAPALYSEYRLAGYRDREQSHPIKPVVEDTKPEEILVDANLEGLIPVLKLPPSSSVIRYLERRCIPRDKYHLLFVAKNFYQWATKYKPEFKDIEDTSPRLVLPYFDVHGRVLGFTARTFAKDVEPRYIHLRIDKNCDFIYGTERIDPSKTIYVFEGQIDALFVENAVGIGNANYAIPFVQAIKTNCIIVPDNDWKRNSQVAKQLKKAIKDGFRICFIPDTVDGKDSNDWAKNGYNVKELIDSNVKQGLNAMLEFAVMKRH